MCKKEKMLITIMFSKGFVLRDVKGQDCMADGYSTVAATSKKADFKINLILTHII